MVHKEEISKSAQKIKKNIYLYPIFLSLVTLFSFSFIIYSSMESYKQEQLSQLEQKLIQKAKNSSKIQLNQMVAQIEEEKKKTEIILKNHIKSRIYEAVDIVQNIIKENKGKSKDELKELASIALAPIRFFEGRGYYLVYDRDTKRSVIHPVKKFIGKDMSNFKDKKGQLLIKLYDDIVDTKGEGYASIYFVNPKQEEDKEYKKIVFVKLIPELNWVIGTGEYLVDVKKSIQKDIIDRMEYIRYGNNGYFWLHSTNHILLMNPYRKKSIGVDDTELVDSKGTKIIQMFVKKALENPKGTFVDYYWKKPQDEEFYKKIGFIKHIPEWDWVIGTGVYLDEIENIIKDEQNKYNQKFLELYIHLSIVFIVILFATFAISLKLSNRIKNEFIIYSNTFKNLNENLENEVKKRTKELNDLNDNLEIKIKDEIEKNRIQEIQLLEQSKFAQMGEMIGNIAHQWRQPLSIISTIASGLKLKLAYEKDLDRDETMNSLDNLGKTTQHLSDTIDHFRDFIKEKRELRTIVVQDRILEVLNIISASLKNNHIELLKELHVDDPIEINIVLGELSQVLINLLNNSKDALIQNNIENRWIKISCSKENNAVVISVEDNAGGIPEHFLTKIFDPYFTTKHQSQGTGIGLYMSKNIIEKHLKGKLYVKNTKNGAKFFIELPLS